ncbi:thioesterase II family protein [Streptomyces laurentii]|uniref:thioesterase II family protein n=1 Tax=Streptomyces laurentii TaxID=39478 RepID=UPI0036A01C7D
MTTANPWLPFGAHPESGIRLLCLPHAGAGATAYRTWGQGLPEQIKACPVQPPGRERRRREEPFTRVDSLTRALAKEIAGSVRGPYALFGHSTGALCAFETAREMRRIGAAPPVHLFVSGRRAPQLPMPRHDVGAMTVPELAQALRRLGGTPEEVLSNPELLALLQPVLAADFSVNETYAHVAEDPLDLPVTAFAGIDDTGADVALMEPWESQTSREFVLHSFPGGHFAVFEHAARVHSLISDALAPQLQTAGRN